MGFGSLPQVGITAYNGYEFPSGETIETTSYRVVPRYDQARRTVVFCEFVIGLRWYIADATDTSPEVIDMVAKLTQAGGALAYFGRGFGNEIVNRGGIVRDVEWGCKPGTLTLAPVGVPLALQVDWQISFSIPTCEDRVFDGVAEWNFGVSYAIDGDGLTTRTTSGHVIIANGRVRPGDRAVVVSADIFRKDVVPGLLSGFKRESQNFNLSLDKSKLDYEVVDREIGGNAPGEGLTSADGSESITNEPGKLFTWVKTLRATYTVAPGRDVGVAWRKFFATYRDRANEARTRIPGIEIVPINFTAEDPSIYGGRQKVTLSLSYRIVNASLASALGATGIWRPVPDSSWRLWMGTTADAFGVRGGIGLRFDVGDDAIVDLCQRKPIPKAKTDTQQSSILGPLGAAAGGILTGLLANILQGAFPAPKKESSWLHYEVFTRIVLDTGALVVKTLPDQPLDRAPVRGDTWDVAKAAKLPQGVGGALPQVVDGQQSQSSSGPPDDTHIQHRVSPTAHVYLTGRAVRYGYDIPHPQLVSVGNLPATLMTCGEPSEGFVSGVVGESLFPVFGAKWNLHYVVPGLAKTGSLPNPFMQQPS